jgi:hypothetical protein
VIFTDLTKSQEEQMKTYKVTYNVVFEYEIPAEDESEAQVRADMDFLPDLQYCAGVGEIYPDVTVEELPDDDPNDHD